MKLFIGGKCSNDAAFDLVDPAGFSEGEFEAHAVKALVCAFPEYRCIPFRADFSFDGQIKRSDLALVHQSFSHSFIVEVELVSHSLMGHVVPQVRCFRYGEPFSSCADLLVEAIPGMEYSRAVSFLQFIPRSVLVVANRYSPEWNSCLRGLDAQMITVTVYQRKDGTIAREIDGSLTVAKENLGFFRYSASDRSIRIPSTVALELEGQVRIEDPYGAIGVWIASKSEDGVWLTKLAGDPGFPHNEMLQVLRTRSGILKLALTSILK
jgi:hypothetical protein